jgi:CubicO group peptidase (beta-lactamase class C family)
MPSTFLAPGETLQYVETRKRALSPRAREVMMIRSFRCGLSRIFGGLLALIAFSVAAEMPATGAELPQCPGGAMITGEGCAAPKEAARQIDRIVRDAMARLDLKAVLVGVAVDGVPILNQAWGESMTGVPATPDMHFRNGSIAIAYLGTLTLRLQDEGILSLDDRLSKWSPEYPKADQVTLAMLLNNTSGYADYVDLTVLPLYQNVFRQWQPDELIGLALGKPVACEPGTCWSYAHTNFVILGKVLEKATGKPLDQLIRDEILTPLALADTRSEASAAIQEPVLHSFDAERGIYEDSTYWNPSWTLARGAVMTTNIADVLTTAAAIGTGRLLSPEAHSLQLAPLTAKFKPWSDTRYYGLGVFTANGWILQNPSFAGYAATMAYLPARKLAIAVSATMGPKASGEGNASTTVLKEISKYLAPEAAQ